MSLGLSEADRMALTQMVMQILSSWGVSNANQVVLLDLPREMRARAVKRYQEDTPLPDSENVMQRVEFIMAIAEALRTSYPQNPQMGQRWINQPHRRFSGRSPLQVMVEDGYSGLVSVRSEVDCTFAWDQTGSRT